MTVETVHATLTGMDAGQPYCGISRAEMNSRGGRGIHLILPAHVDLLTCADCAHIANCEDDGCFERDHIDAPHPDQSTLF